MDITNHILIRAANEKNIKKFLYLVFPPEWYSVAARIIESGAEFSDELCPWAPRWSPIPWTIKKGSTDLEAALKTVMYRSHDCFHQLWGLPTPSFKYTEDEFYNFKRSQMCGEVVVLTLTELMLAEKLYYEYPEVRPYLEKRCGIQMMKGPLNFKSPIELVTRMDDILHKQRRPKWLRDHLESTKFYDYYMPMLEDDRNGVDWNWKVMKEQNWLPVNAPNSTYSKNLDGLELTIWMMEDFLHLLDTDIEIDYDLMMFNRNRRSRITFPEKWGKHNKL